MKTSKKKKLKSKGWKIGPASEFLGLSKKESNTIEKKFTHRNLPTKTQKK